MMTHVSNIYRVIHFSKNYAAILCKEQFNFGISQKLLTLYLKYSWCLKQPLSPPHFPVDRIIQQKLNYKYLPPWTQMTNEIEY